MANLRILYNNIADLASSVTAVTEVNATMGASKLLTEVKTEVLRSTNTSLTITYNWSLDQNINCVILPCTNITNTGTIRIKLYDSLNVLLYDSTAIQAVESTQLYSGTNTYNVNLFSYGFFSKTAVWLPNTINNIRKLEIIISDPSNTTGYIDCSRVLAGVYWSPTYNITNGMQLYSVDDSSTSRTNAGNLVSNRGFLYDKLSFNFALLTDSDKAELYKISKYIGTNKNFFVSIFPEASNTNEEHDYMIYGKRSNSIFSYKLFGYYDYSMEIISW